VTVISTNLSLHADNDQFYRAVCVFSWSFMNLNWYSVYTGKRVTIMVCFPTDTKLEQNQVSGFLTLMRNMIQTKPVNQQTFVQTNGAAIIGALLQKVIALLNFQGPYYLVLLENPKKNLKSKLHQNVYHCILCVEFDTVHHRVF